MMGDINEHTVNILDSVLDICITQHCNTNTIIHLIYSKKENTYNEHIKYLLDKFHTTNITLHEKNASLRITMMWVLILSLIF